MSMKKMVFLAKRVTLRVRNASTSPIGEVKKKMFWLMKKIFSLGVLVAIVFFVFQYKIGGKTVKDYAVEFYDSPIFQEAVRQGNTALREYLAKKESGQPQKEDAPAMDPLSEEERAELEKVLKKNHR